MSRSWVNLMPKQALLYFSLTVRVLATQPPALYSRPRVRKGKPISAQAVFASAAHGDTIALSRLIAAGANVNTPWQGLTPLMAASMENQRWAVKHLLEAKANPNIRHPSGLTALLCAIRNRNFTIMEQLLDGGALPKALVKGDLEPLYLAALCGNEFILERIRKAMVRRGPSLR
jgi:ankyrin repeat protein